MLLKPGSVTSILQKSRESLLKTDSVADFVIAIYNKGQTLLKVKGDSVKHSVTANYKKSLKFYLKQTSSQP